MTGYATHRLRALLLTALVRLIFPRAQVVHTARPREDAATARPPRRDGGTRRDSATPPPVEVPPALRVGRAVAASRAMVQAANSLAAAGEDVPTSLHVSLGYEDGPTVFMGMSLLGPGEEEVEDGDLP